MATTTVTKTDNDSSSNKATWTLQCTGNDYTITTTNQTFTHAAPTLKAKYTASNKGYGGVYCSGDIYINGVYYGGGMFMSKDKAYFSADNLASMTSGTYYTINNYGSSSYTQTIYGSHIFNDGNPTTKQVPITIPSATLWTMDANNKSGSKKLNGFTGTASFGTIGYVYYNCKPTISSLSYSYSTPYAGIGAYTLSFTIAQAYYGGNVTSIKLTIGSQSQTKSYSASIISSGTLSITPTTAGTFTPTVTITDSRGISNTYSMTTITVNAYNIPTLSFDVYRTDSSGIKSDEGTYGVVAVTMTYTSAVATLTAPTISIINSSGTSVSASTTWYTSWTASGGVSSAISSWSAISSGATVYGLVSPSSSSHFSISSSYKFTMRETDSRSGSSAYASAIMSTAFYTMDFQAGGKEIVFGGSASDSMSAYDYGLFKCDMDMGLQLYVDGSASSSTDATSGEDKDLFNAIRSQGWYNSVIELNNMLNLKSVLYKIIDAI